MFVVTMSWRGVFGHVVTLSNIIGLHLYHLNYSEACKNTFLTNNKRDRKARRQTFGKALDIPQQIEIPKENNRKLVS